jgi:hypothetical protein
MKRKKRECNGYKVSLKKIWPIFSWKWCFICNKEFRRELGWEHITHAFPLHVPRYVCRKCCSTEDEVLDSVNRLVEDYKKCPPVTMSCSYNIKSSDK